MNREGLASVPRDKRPSLDELEGYTESRYEPDTDYSAYRRELAVWLHDWHRDQELERVEGKSQPLYADDEAYGQANGYDKDKFLEKAVRTIKSRPMH